MKELIERLRSLDKPRSLTDWETVGDVAGAAADALEAQGREIEELREALGCEMDDTRNACGVLNDEIYRLQSRLAAAEQEQANRRIVAMGEMNDALLRERDEAVASLRELRECVDMERHPRGTDTDACPVCCSVRRSDAFLAKLEERK